MSFIVNSKSCKKSQENTSGKVKSFSAFPTQ